MFTIQWLERHLCKHLSWDLKAEKGIFHYYYESVKAEDIYNLNNSKTKWNKPKVVCKGKIEEKSGQNHFLQKKAISIKQKTDIILFMLKNYSNSYSVKNEEVKR